MEEIKIYSPSDGELLEISSVKDEVFSNGLLGEGFFVKPTSTSNEVFSPLDEGKIALVFDTKHAFYIQNNDLNVLIHIGLDTVNLNGEPFSDVIEINTEVTKKSILAKVNLELLKQKDIDDSVIVAFDPETTKKMKLIITKTGYVKSGEEIGYLSLNESEINNIKVKKIEKSSKNKWIELSQELINEVGGKENFSSYYNCMTRLRFKIIEKDLVDEKLILKHSLVKGVKWNGDELQVIIGGDVYKAKDQMDFILKKEKVKNEISVGRKIMAFISGVMVPALPVLMATGIIAGLQALFVQLGWIKTPSADLPETQLDLFSMIMYIGSKVGLELIGVVFCYNTVKYLGGDPIMGIFLGLALTTRHLLGAGFGADAAFLQHDGKGYLLLKMFGNNIYVKNYESSIIPLISGGIFLFYFDKWVKKWMPGCVDIVFRPALVFFASFCLTLFLIGPFTGIIEQILGQAVVKIGDLPGGIGVGIVAGLWQILVVTGTHVAVANAVKLPIMTGQSSAMAAIFGIAILSQFGALLGVFIRTKNQKLKQAAAASIPSILFGISEPTIYGINLPKVRPFFAGCVGAFIGGILSGVLKLQATVIGAGGVLQVMWFTNRILDSALYGLCMFTGASVALLITIAIYKERPDEKSEIEKIKKRIAKSIDSKGILTNKEFIEIFNGEFDELKDIFSTNKTTYKQFEKLLLSKINLEVKIEKNNSENDKKIENLLSKKKINSKKEKYIKRLRENKKNQEMQHLLNIKNIEIDNLGKEINEFEKKALIKVTEILGKISAKTNTKLDDYFNNFYNAINSLMIAYELKEKKSIMIEKNKKILKLRKH